MANAAVYYYPNRSSALKRIDLTGPLSSLRSQTYRDQVTSQSMTGSISRTIWTAYHVVDFSVEMLKSQVSAAELEAFVDYMRGGGVCALTEDRDGVFAGFASMPPNPGDTNVFGFKNQFSDFESGAPSTGLGDYLAIQAPSPKLRYERIPILSRTGQTFTLSSPVLKDRTLERWVFFRDARFWPFLQLRPGTENQAMLSPRTPERITWDLRMQCFEPAYMIEAASELMGEAPFGGVDIDIGIDTSGLPNYNDLLAEIDAPSQGTTLNLPWL